MRCWFCRFKGKDNSNTFKHMWRIHPALMPTGKHARSVRPTPINPLFKSAFTRLIRTEPKSTLDITESRETIRDEIRKQFAEFIRTIGEESDRKDLLAPKKPAVTRFSFTLFGFTISR